MKLCFATDETAYTSRTQKKRPIFDHRLCFSMWSRLGGCDTISLKPHAHQSQNFEASDKDSWSDQQTSRASRAIRSRLAVATIFARFWRYTGVHLRQDLLLHDLIIQTICRGLQYDTVVLGILDALVYAHNHHRHNLEYPGNSHRCMEGRIRLMTALTPPYAHAFQNLFPARRPDSIVATYHVFSQLRAKVVMSMRDGPLSPTEEPI